MRDRCYLRGGIEVAEGDVVLDVGANVGIAAIFFAAVCGASAVHSFEPAPPIFELLCENVAKYPAVTPHPYAISDSEREADFTFYRDAAAMSGFYADAGRDSALVRRTMTNLGQDAGEIDTALASRYASPEVFRSRLRPLSAVIPELGLERVDLLKIDVERAELDVLAGVGPADWPLIRQLVVEIHDEEGAAAATASDLEERGFRVEVGQDEAMRGTGVKMLYGRRP